MSHSHQTPRARYEQRTVHQPDVTRHLLTVTLDSDTDRPKPPTSIPRYRGIEVLRYHYHCGANPYPQQPCFRLVLSRRLRPLLRLFPTISTSTFTFTFTFTFTDLLNNHIPCTITPIHHDNHPSQSTRSHFLTRLQRQAQQAQGRILRGSGPGVLRCWMLDCDKATVPRCVPDPSPSPASPRVKAGAQDGHAYPGAHLGSALQRPGLCAGTSRVPRRTICISARDDGRRCGMPASTAGCQDTCFSSRAVLFIH